MILPVIMLMLYLLSIAFVKLIRPDRAALASFCSNLGRNGRRDEGFSFFVNF